MKKCYKQKFNSLCYNKLMIDRYSRDEMKKIWELNSKFDYYLKVEIAVCEAYSKTGKIPGKDLDEIKKRAKFNIERIDEIEKEVRHDVIAFLTNVNENLGKYAKYMHVGMTSSDVIDTAFALQIKDSGKRRRVRFFSFWRLESPACGAVCRFKICFRRAFGACCSAAEGLCAGARASMQNFLIFFLRWWNQSVEFAA